MAPPATSRPRMVVFMLPRILPMQVPTVMAVAVDTSTATSPSWETHVSERNSPSMEIWWIGVRECGEEWCTLVREMTMRAHQLFQTAWGTAHTTARAHELGLLTCQGWSARRRGSSLVK